MSVTIDCGEGKHDLCTGRSKKRYLIPQLDGVEFVCQCPCHDDALRARSRWEDALQVYGATDPITKIRYAEYERVLRHKNKQRTIISI